MKLTIKQFLIRYGESWVPWASAKATQVSALKRRIEEDERRAKVRSAMANIEANSASSSSSVPAKTREDRMRAEVVSAAHDVMEDGELDLPQPTTQENVGLSEEEKAAQLRVRAAEWELKTEPLVHKIRGQPYIKFKHLLWEAPSRGMFDVQRIKQSAYFFS